MLLSCKYGTWLYLPESTTLTFYECQHNDHNEVDDVNKTLCNPPEKNIIVHKVHKYYSKSLKKI